MAGCKIIIIYMVVAIAIMLYRWTIFLIYVQMFRADIVYDAIFHSQSNLFSYFLDFAMENIRQM